MKKCYKCNVKINADVTKCPLCDSPINGKECKNDVFPVIPTMYMKHKLFFKIFFFLSVFGCIVCMVMNYFMEEKIGWSWFVIAGIFSFWCTFIIGIRRRNHFMRLLFAEVILIIVASIGWDYFIGWQAWSITYVLPFLSIAYITALFILRIFMKNIFRDYVIYIYINSLIGLIPFIFILRNSLKVRWPSILCVIFSVFVILVLAVFNHNQMKNELQRRFHI